MPYPRSRIMNGISALIASTFLAFSVGAVSPAGVVEWTVEHQRRSLTALRRRGSTFDEIIGNQKNRGGYFATCSIGTPPQNLTLHLDTGSGDIWVPNSAADVCHDGQGCTLGAFDPSLSESFEMAEPGQFSVRYVDGSHSDGDYFTDHFEIGGAAIKNFTMGLGLETDISYGLAGIGYPPDTAAMADMPGGAGYLNLPTVLMREGLINTVAYSLWLNDPGADSGSILFGGVDTAKYVGNMTRISLCRDAESGAFTSFRVNLTSLEAVSPSRVNTVPSIENPVPVVLDSGTTLSYLPDDLARQVWREAGAIYAQDIGLAVIPCDMADAEKYFSFGFAGANGPRIDMKMDELVLGLASGQPPVFVAGPYDGQTACEFGIQNFTDGPFILGDTFLRSAYVVYDLSNNEIGIAATDFNATDTSIVPFPSLSARIPGATPIPSQIPVAPLPMATPTVPAVTYSSRYTAASPPTPKPTPTGDDGPNRSQDRSEKSGSNDPLGRLKMGVTFVVCTSASFLILELASCLLL